jgi:hypothetical protein
MIIEKYSMGSGDRFAHQGKAQLAAVVKAKADGVDIVPVWNKSHREHTTIKTEPASLRTEADDAVKALGWQESYYVDADHIGLGTVDLFMACSNFFTLDVADAIGKPASDEDIATFLEKHKDLIGSITIEGIAEPVKITEALALKTAKTYLFGVKEAKRIYDRIKDAKGADNFVTEISIDETDAPQTPVEMLLILAAIGDEGIPIQTIAPKFTGRFNKGVDYVGDVAQFSKEFEEDLAVIAYAIKKYGLPKNLKLSVHSGSDKFSIYGAIHRAINNFDAGLHVKTAGTTWLEELIGLASAGDDGLEIAKEIYAIAYGRFDELCGPYATVIDIDPAQLPTPDEVNGWDGEKYANSLRHVQSCSDYNPNFRQLLHVGYKVAAEMGERYLRALEKYEEIVSKNVTENLYERHIKPIFLGN